MCSWSFPTHCTGVENPREEGQGLTVSDYTHLWGLEGKVETNFATACSVLVAYTLWKETENKYFFINTDRWRLKELPKSNSNSGCFWEGIQNFTFERERILGQIIFFTLLQWMQKDGSVQEDSFWVGRIWWWQGYRHITRTCDTDH